MFRVLVISLPIPFLGRTTIGWIALLAFIIVMSMTWAERVNESRENAIPDEVRGYYNGTADGEALAMDEKTFIEIQRERLHDADNTSVLVIMALFGISLAVMLVNYLSMQRWEKKAIEERDETHISTKDVVISGCLSDYEPDRDANFHDVFERADALMYEEKKLLKGMGAITREDAGEDASPVLLQDESSEILRIKRYVLIVEDEIINQEMPGNILGDGYELLYAANGLEALEPIKGYIDDLALVLLDLQMPQMSGVEVLKVMKEEAELRDIPVIVMTADQSTEVVCLKIGAIDFVPKPYPSFEIIQARVNRCIELSEKRSIIESTERDSLTNLFNLDYFLRFVRLYDQHYADTPTDAIRPRALWTRMCPKTGFGYAWACTPRWTSRSRSSAALTMRRSPRIRSRAAIGRPSASTIPRCTRRSCSGSACWRTSSRP